MMIVDPPATGKLFNDLRHIAKTSIATAVRYPPTRPEYLCDKIRLIQTEEADGLCQLRGRMIMTIQALIIWLVIGAVAGWLAGQIMRGYGFGLVGNIVVGIVGAFIAGWLLPRIGFVLIGGIAAEIINAVIGAVILLAVIGFLKKPG